MALSYEITASDKKFFWKLSTEGNINSPLLTSIPFDTEDECNLSIELSKKLVNNHNFEFISTKEGCYFSQVTFDEVSIARSPIFANRLFSESNLQKLRHSMRAFIPKITNESVLSILSDFICLHARPLLNSYTGFTSQVYSEYGPLLEIKYESTIFDTLPQSIQDLLYDKEFVIEKGKKYIVVDKLRSLVLVYWHSIIPTTVAITQTITITENDSLQNIRVYQYLRSLYNESEPIANLSGKSLTYLLRSDYSMKIDYIPTDDFSLSLITSLNEME